jgi:hypothetical protein
VKSTKLPALEIESETAAAYPRSKLRGIAFKNQTG